jgi:tetratricopeptide (TPR) repeat protein
MTDPEHSPDSPEPDAFADVVALLEQARPALPTDLEARLEAAVAKASDAPRELSDLRALIERDADEAWSLASAVFGEAPEPSADLDSLADSASSPDPAWETLVEAFARIAKSDAEESLTSDEVLTRVAEAALGVACRSALEIAPPELLRPQERIGLLLRAGLGLRGELTLGGVALSGADLSQRLVAAYPQSGSEELRVLVARELVDELSVDEVSRLDRLRQANPLEATLISDHYREVTEVAPGVCVRSDELAGAVEGWEPSDSPAASTPETGESAGARTGTPKPGAPRLVATGNSTPEPWEQAPRERSGLSRRLFRASRRNVPVVVLSGAMCLVLSGAVGLIVWKSQAAEERRLEVAARQEWATFQDRFQKGLSDAEAGVKQAQTQLAANEAREAFSELVAAERSLKGLVELEAEFSVHTPPARLRAYAVEFRGLSEDSWRDLLQTRSRALVTFGPESYEAALRSVMRGLDRHAQAPGPDELGRSGRSHAEALANFASDVEDLQIQRARVEALLGRTDAALATLAAVLRERSNSLEALLEQGRVRHQRGDYVEALGSFSAALQLDSKAISVYLSRGETLLALRRPADAARDFEEAIGIDDSSFEAFLSLGRAQVALGEFGEAQDNLTEAIDIMPSLPEGYLERGRLFVARRRYPQARKDFEVAISRSAECYPAYLELGRTCERMFEEDAALAAYRGVLEAKAQAGRGLRAEALAALGQLNLTLADPQVAAAEFDLEHRLAGADGRGRPGPFPSLTRLQSGRQALITKRLDEARTQLAAAVQIEPTLVAARLSRARLAYREGDLATLGAELGALEKIFAARPRVELEPDAGADEEWGAEEAWDEEEEARLVRNRLVEAECLALRGLLAQASDQSGEARGFLQAALEADPQCALAKSALAKLSLGGDREGARRLYAEAREAQGVSSDESGFFFQEGLRHGSLARRTKGREHLGRARRSFARARISNPLHARSYLEEGRLCADWPAYDAALSCLDEAIRCDPFLWEAHQLRGLLLSRDLPLKRDALTQRPQQVRDPLQGRESFDLALAVAPKGQGAEAYYGRALASIALAGRGQRDQLATARRDLEAAIREVPEDLARAEPRVFMRALAYLRAQAQVAEALQDSALQARVSERLEEVEAASKVAVARELEVAMNLRDRLNYSEAIKRFDLAVELDPESSEALYARGTCYLKIGNFVPGILDFSRALELDPRIADQVYNKVYQISYVVDLNRVITEMNKIVADHPNVSYVVFLRGFFYVAKTEFKQVADEDLIHGIEDFTRCLELNPDHVTAYLYRGFLFGKLGARRGEPAESAPKDEWDLDEDPSLDLLDSRAECFARSLEDFERALKLDPKSGIAHYLRSLHWARRASEPGLDASEVRSRQERALESLRSAFASEFMGYERVRNEKAFDSVRELPEFKELMRGK